MAIKWKEYTKTRHPGVWKRMDGTGFALRVRKKHPVTGETVDVARKLENATETEAAVCRLEIVKEIEEGTYGEEETVLEIPTLGDYAGRWLKRKKKEGVRPHSVDGYRSALENHILPELGDLRLGEITSKHIYQWKDAAADKLMKNGKPYSRWTVAAWFTVVRNIVREAVSEYSLPHNPCDGVRGVRKPRSPKASRYLDSAQLREFLRLVELCCRQHYAVTLVLVVYGLRWEEASGLHIEHVDEEAMELRIVQAHVRKKIYPTKNESHKILPLHPDVLEAIRAEQERLRVEENPGLEEGILFPGKTGQYRVPASVYKGFKTVSEAMGLSWVVTPHDLRRSCQNLLRRASVSQVVQQAVLGHSSDAMTQHYSHVGMDEKRQGVDGVVDILKYREKKEESA